MTVRTRLASMKSSRPAASSRGGAARRVRQAAAVVGTTGTAVLLSACGGSAPDVPNIACEKGKPAGALPELVTLHQDGFFQGGASPKFKIIGDQNGVQVSYGTVTARSWSETSNRASAQNPCDARYASSEEKFKFFSDDETIKLHGPAGVTFKLEKEWLKSVFAREGSNEFVLKGPNGENVAVSRKTEARGGAVTIKLHDPATGRTLGLVEREPGHDNRWIVESMSEKVPSWLLTQIVGLKSADDGREGA